MTEVMEQVIRKIENIFYDLLGGDSDFDKEGGYSPCADLADAKTEEILSIPIKGKTIKELIEGWASSKIRELDDDQSLPKLKLDENALNAIEVRGIFPHVSKAITQALAHQSKAIQQDMLKEHWAKFKKEK